MGNFATSDLQVNVISRRLVELQLRGVQDDESVEQKDDPYQFAFVHLR